LTRKLRRDENGGVVRAAALASLVFVFRVGRVARVAQIAWLVSLGLGAAACRGRTGDAAPPCSAVAARFMDIARHELASAKVDEATSRAVSDQLPAMRDALAGACSDGTWGESLRNCLVHASDRGGFETCEQQLSDEQRRDLDRATRGNPETR
jgi:hypothetical protein